MVDDDEVDRIAVSRALRLGHVGADVTEAIDLGSAKRALLGKPIDCVLLDFALPDGDGFDLLRTARDAGIDSAIVMLTGQGDEALAVELIKQGAGDYLPKHLLSPERLAQSIRAVLRVRDAERRERDARAAVQRQASQLHDLARASVRIHETFGATQILERLTREARGLIGAHIAVGRLRGESGMGESVTRASVSDKHEAPASQEPFPASAVVEGLLLRSKGLLRLTHEQVSRHPKLAALRSNLDGGSIPLRGLLAAPLVGREGRLLGTFLLSDRVSGEFVSSDEAMLIHLAQTAAVALDNARLYRAAREATRRRDDVLAIVSHDLRNPLNTISMSAEILRMNAEDSPTKAARDLPIVQRIERDVVWMNRLIEDLLDTSRIDNGKLSVELRPERGASLLQEARDAALPLAHAKGLRLELGPTQDAVHVLADRARILQVFSNLLGNSIKFTPRGGVIMLAMVQEEERGCFSVADNGPGIDVRYREHLFKQYWKAPESSRDGAGLGLFIAHGIIAAHGGDIRVDSQLGQGTTVRFCLPVASA